MREQIPKGPAVAPALPLSRASFGTSQRKCACGGSGSSGGECEECKKKQGPTLQRRAAGRSDPSAVPSIVHDVLRSPGQPLDPAARAWLEPRFGHNFSRVRVHADSAAAESARTVNALAYTVGRDVVFAAGQYAPHSTAGQRLLAHELTHVLQQPGGGEAMQAVPSSRDGDAHEREAEALADRIVSSPGRSPLPTVSPLRLMRFPDTKQPGPECSESRAKGQKLPLVADFAGERGFATLPANGYPGPGGFLLFKDAVEIKISAHWEEQIPNPPQRPPEQQNRRPDSPQYYLRLNGWADACSAGEEGSPASSVQSGNLSIGADHNVPLRNLRPGRYGLEILPSTAAAEPNRVLKGHAEVT
jgi:hypothetical protein